MNTEEHASARPHTSTVATLRRLLPYVRPARQPLLLSALAALGATLAGLSIPLLTQRIVDGPITHGNLAELPWLIAAVLGLGLLEAGLFFARRALIARPTTLVEARMRADLYHHLQRLPIAFHDQWQSGQLLSRAISDLSTIRRFVAFAAIFLIVNTLTLIVGMGMLCYLSPALGLVVAVCNVPLLAISFSYESKYKLVARKAQDQAGDLATTIEESVLGIRVLKAFGRGPHMVRHFTQQALALRATELRKISILSLLWGAITVLPEIAIAGELGVGGLGIASGSMTIGTLVAAVTAATYLRWPVDSIGWLLAETNSAAAACERYWEVRDTPVAITDPADPVPLGQPVQGHLRFSGVHFGHPGAGTELLRGVDLTVRPGETVALVGATGSGKTTLLALVPRLLDVTSGAVLLDGVDVRDLALGQLRRVVATAFEEPVLFSASVRENVTLGCPDASDEQVRQALGVAHAMDFVEALPWGMDTRIGEQGLSLSGGQRQRLALARAVISMPAVLVLDDPLSALDVHTEAEVETALRRVLHGVTALVVAHRPSTVALADRVALLADGRIIATGSHRELLASSPAYQALLSTMDVPAAARPGEEVATP